MAQRRAVAATVVIAILASSAATRAQSFAGGTITLGDVDPPPNDAAEPPPPPPLCVCPRCLPPPPDAPSEDELEAVLVGGVSAAALGYLVSNVMVAQQTHRTPTVDSIPVFGAVWSVAHNSAADRSTPLLLFTAGVQAIGILVTIAAATELHDLRNLELAASPTGAGVTYTWRY